MNRLIQTIYIKFSDGQTGVFSGPAVVNPADAATLRIVDIKFGTPRELPKDCSWDEMEETD